ncbi:hypothetical protein VTH06DRAFT_220, partial [Thermothelomyces fergusii]
MSGGGSQFRATISGAIPRPSTSMRESRIPSFRNSTTTHPSYNTLAGEPNVPGGATASPRPRQGSVPGPSPPRGRAAVAASSISRESSKENRPPADAEEYEAQRRRIEELKAE